MKDKQTAVQWLEDNLIGNPHFESDFIHNRNAFEQAKQMEKDQITKAYNSAIPFKFGEQYYNETYANDTTKGLPEEDSKRRAWHY